MMHKKPTFLLVLGLLSILSCQINDGLADDDFITIDNYSIEIQNLPIKIKVGNREVKAYLSKKEGLITDVVLGLHGGTTTKKSSEDAAKDYNLRSDGGRPFIQAGFTSLSLEYTEFEDNGDKATRGIKEMEEVLAAVDFMLNDGLSENNVTFDRVFVMGNSRGGGNALLSGIERAVDGVISTAGPLDWIATYDSIQSGYLEPTDEELIFFNESIAAWGDPHEDPSLWTKYSPGLRVTQFQSPFLVVSGTNDAVVMIETAARMKEVYDACGACVEGAQFVVHENGHSDWATETVLGAIMDFVEE